MLSTISTSMIPFGDTRVPRYYYLRAGSSARGAMLWERRAEFSLHDKNATALGRKSSPPRSDRLNSI